MNLKYEPASKPLHISKPQITSQAGVFPAGEEEEDEDDDSRDRRLISYCLMFSSSLLLSSPNNLKPKLE